jgi:pyruvate formate lyase activating enzyme
MVKYNMEKEAYLYEKLSDNKVRCKDCAHFCQISPGQRGICKVREDAGGKLFALNYGKLAAINIDPVEKKPLFHFLPGTKSLSFAAMGCNFSCLNCQNWDISQDYKSSKEILGRDLSPEDIVKLAKKNKLPSISYTYSEPTIFLEYALDTMKIARKNGLKNIWVSNGFMSEESAKMVIPYLDANNIDIKGFSDELYRKLCGASLQPVLDTAKLIKKSGVWLEITTLAIPGLSDSEEMLKNIAKFIYNELGAETPWHISAFSADISWKLHDVSDTPVETLEMAYKIGKNTGLEYVYTGNSPNLPSEDTFCPKCGALAIDRTDYVISRHDLKGKCQKCGTDLNIID